MPRSSCFTSIRWSVLTAEPACPFVRSRPFLHSMTYRKSGIRSPSSTPSISGGSATFHSGPIQGVCPFTDTRFYFLRSRRLTLVDGEGAVTAASRSAGERPCSGDGVTVHCALKSELIIRAAGECGGDIHSERSRDIPVKVAAEAERTSLRGSR